MRLICHIGLGKTGTTYLQNKLLPALHEQGILNYIDVRQEINNLFAPSGKIFPNNLSLHAFTSKLKGGLVEDKVNFISHESLCGWDPAIWEHNARLCKKILPDFSEILISIREPRSLFISMYSQMLKEGARNLNIEHYLLGGERYKVLKNALGDLVSKRHIDVDNFSYERLSSLWKSLGFASVRIIDFRRFFKTNNLLHCLSLNDSSAGVAIKVKAPLNQSITVFGYRYIKSRDFLLDYCRINRGEGVFRSILMIERNLLGFCHGNDKLFSEKSRFVRFVKFHNSIKSVAWLDPSSDELIYAPTLFLSEKISHENYFQACSELSFLLCRDNWRQFLEMSENKMRTEEAFALLVFKFWGTDSLDKWEPVNEVYCGRHCRKNIDFCSSLQTV